MKSSFDGPCASNDQCKSGVCTNSLCANPTGSQLGASCDANSDNCAASKCFQPTSINTCQKFIANGAACLANEDYCGPGYFCSRTAAGNEAGTCKQLHIGTYTESPITTANSCPSNNLVGNTCTDVTVTSNSLTLDYPYKAATSATCSYPGLSGGATKTAHNGYCPIVQGMPEMKDYTRAAVTFLSTTEVQNWAWLPVTAYKQFDTTVLAPYFAAATGTLNSTFTVLSKHWFRVTHTNILEESCSILGDTCGPEVPGYQEDFNTHCRGEESYTFTCGATANGACMEKTYGLNANLNIKFSSNTAINNEYKCNSLNGPTAFADQTYSQNSITPEFIVPPRPVCSATAPKSCLDWECGTVQDDANDGLICEQGRCKTSSHSFCRQSTNMRYATCTNQGDCGASLFCDIADNTCKTATASLSHTCTEDVNCADTQYCSSGSCTNRMATSATGCTADNQCMKTDWCNNANPRTCVTKFNIGANSCANNEDQSCNNSYCSGTTCTALVSTLNTC